MVIDRLVVDNVGIFAGRNSMELRPPQGRPIILVGGLNGGGKTTILEAIHLCLYGRNASWSHRNKQGYLDYLGSLINHHADPGTGAKVELTFERMNDGEAVRFTVIRSWKVERGTVRENVDAFRNGEHDPLLSQNWEEYIEAYLPGKLANLFFFDGEQIAELAERESASRILSSAVQTLLGLDVVGRLDSDLVILDRRKRTEMKSDADRARIEDLRKTLEAAEREVEQIRNQNLELNTDLLRLRQELSDWKKRYRKSGGDLFDRREQFEAERAVIQRDLTQAEANLREIAAGIAPLLLVEKQLSRVETHVERELEARHHKIVAEAEKARDGRILKELKGKVSDEVLKTIDRTLAKFRPDNVAFPEGPSLNPEETFPATLRAIRRAALPSAREDLRKARNYAVQLREAIARLEQQIDAVPAAESLAEINKEIADREAAITETEKRLIVAADRLKQAEVNEQNAKTILNRALGGLADTLEIIEETDRMLTRIPKVRQTLEAFRIKMVERHASRLESLILESFRQLLRKENLVTGLKIHPSTFELKLYGADGRELHFERLSAGERQLLATAILWGLAKASGRPLPTVIDTPLGRLDSSHRTNLVQRYFPAVSHQVILLSTDEEIDDRYGAMLRSYVGRTYRLAFNAANRSTQIEEGYFPNEAAC